MSRQKSNQNLSTSSMGAMTTTTAFSDGIHSGKCVAQNFLLIWLDADIDQSKQDHQNFLVQLRSIANNVNIFTEPDECIDFLTEVHDMKVFLILGSTLGQQIVPLIHDIPQLDDVCIFCSNQSPHEHWTKEWAKIKGVYTDIKPICEAVQLAAKQCNQDSIAVSFVKVDEEISSKKLDELGPAYMYTQLFKEILLNMKYDQQSITDFTTYCRNSNYETSSNIDRFENEYQAHSTIWWYTFSTFTYSMLNYALRNLEVETIIKMGFFIRDLHYHIQYLHEKQVGSYYGHPFIVYRGQCLVKADFKKLLETRGWIISFNNFLSTSKNKEVSLAFASSALYQTDMVGILFKMFIDPSIVSVPFAAIQEISCYQTEEEVLFSMQAVFRIGEITQIDHNSSLYQVELTLTSHDDHELRSLTERMRMETLGSSGSKGLGVLLVKMGYFDKAEKLYEILLEQASDDSEKATYYNQLGYINDDQGDYEKSISYYEKALDMRQITLPSNHPAIAASYNNLGSVYYSMGEYSKAQAFYNKTLEIQRKLLPPNHPSLAASYNNIARVLDNMGEHSKALSFFEKTLEIDTNTLPPNHPEFAVSYNNIGLVYHNIGEYSKALSFYKKALEIKQETLLPGHPDLITSYNNIGLVYDNMGEYSKALQFYEKAVEISQKTFAPNHPLFAISYNNIGGLYKNMGEYSKALSFYEKALEVRRKTLPPNHPDLATSYNNIGGLYRNFGEYSKALSFYEKAIEIQQKTLPPNHPDLASSYENTGIVYDNMGECAKALSFLERAVEVRQKTLPPNHPDLATLYSNIGSVYDNMGQYSKALSFSEKALEISQTVSPPNHLHLATSYNCVGGVYYNRGDYAKALSFYEKALEIRRQILSSNHPDLATSFDNIGMVYDNMRECSKALSLYVKALEIRQETLSPNHPDLANSYNNIGLIYYNVGEYQKAHSYFERAQDIWEHSLPFNHRYLQTVRESIENVKKKLS